MMHIENIIPMLFLGRKARRPLALCLGLLLACSGCRSNQTETPIAVINQEVEAGLENQDIRTGGQLLIYIPEGENSLDPFLCKTTEMQSALSLTYEKLIRYDGTLLLSPSLAESWEAMDEEGLKWKISLRKGVIWHGTNDPFTSADVLYTVKLLKSEEYTQSTYAYAMEQIAEITAPDDYTLEVTASNPGMLVMHAFTFPVVSAKHFRLRAQPVGTGPYRMTYAKLGNGLMFEVNSNWWKTAPYIQSVVAKQVTNNNAALQAVESQELNYVPTTVVTSGSYQEIGEIGVISTQTQQSEALFINHNNPLLSSLNVRKAIAYALNRRDIISKAYMGHASATDVPISPNSWLYSSESNIYDYNAERATSFLLEDGWADLDGDGFLEKGTGDQITKLSFRLLVNDTPDNSTRKDAATIIKTNLENIGISVEIVTATWNDSQNEYLIALQSGSFDLALVGFNMDYNCDLRPFLQPGGSKNYGNYSNAEMTALLDTASKAVAEKDFRAVLKEIQQKFVEDLPYIHLYFRNYSIVYNERLSLASVADIRYSSPFYGMEKWYFTDEGREMFSNVTLPGNTDWASFDQLPVEETESEQTASPEAAKTPRATTRATSAPSTRTATPSTPEPATASGEEDVPFEDDGTVPYEDEENVPFVDDGTVPFED